ncbi:MULTISPECIES: hypothetical protein [Escherichia]
MQKLPLKEKCLTTKANYHSLIRYVMELYTVTFIYSSLYARFR